MQSIATTFTSRKTGMVAHTKTLIHLFILYIPSIQHYYTLWRGKAIGGTIKVNSVRE
jgi:hypothetical protein